jgi:precorrin-6Y C5,15-methyltransferase (decarboxylating)
LSTTQGTTQGTPRRVHIIGIGDDGREGLTVAAREILDQAEHVLAAPVLLDRLQLGPRGVPIGGNLEQLVEQLRGFAGHRTVLLSSGDPLFYGVARFLCDRLGKDYFEVVPHVSSMQLAFARVKESWDDAYLANLATQPLDRVLEKIRLAEKIGLFTTDEVGPPRIAAELVARQVDYFTIYVCENLGSPDERVTQADPTDIAGQRFSPLNVMILVRKPDVPDRPAEMRGLRLFGNRDDLFLQSQPKRGLLTPMEVRVLALAELDLGPSSVVWDVGAGSGSVAIEAARLAPQGTVYAIEMDPEDHQLMASNAERFQVGPSLVRILGAAPDAWKDIPDPDAVFVGGTGRAVGQIVALALGRLKVGGRLVVNTGSMDNVLAIREVLLAVKGDATLRMLQISHGTDQLDRLALEGRSPTFLWTFVKGA